MHIIHKHMWNMISLYHLAIWLHICIQLWICVLLIHFARHLSNRLIGISPAWRVFDVTIHFFASWRVFDVMTNAFTLWRIFDERCGVMVYFLTSWRTFLTSWCTFDVMTYFWRHGAFLKSWRTLTSWRTFYKL